jgi:hypothetical protein
MDYAYQGKQPPTKLAAMVATSNAQHSDQTYWLSDTGATDHFTPDLTTIPDHQDYAGGDLATVSNGHALPITHIGRAGPEVLVAQAYPNFGCPHLLLHIKKKKIKVIS